MITRVHGKVRSVQDEVLTLAVEPWEIEVLIPESARRQLQGQIGNSIDLHTQFFLEGNQLQGRYTPRLVGFLTPLDREFCEIFCSVDGVGVKKALRAISMPVRDLARMIQDSDVKSLSLCPGIGEALAERIVAKLRKKVGKFALMVLADGDKAHTANGVPEAADADVLRDTYMALVSVGHTDSHARQLIDRVLAGSKRKYKNVADLIDAIYAQEKGPAGDASGKG